MVTVVQQALSFIVEGFLPPMCVSVVVNPFSLSVVVVILYPSFNTTVENGVVLFG
jgi:hypothetical protein